jgi:DNA-binding MarR family transcriptional regulator
MRIEDEINQKQFNNEFQKAHINIIFTAAWLNQRTLHILKPFGISPQQFNILRILRGLHPQPAGIKLLTERMIDKMSNASRLVEKLLQKGLVVRTECGKDRRRVDVVITPQGLELLQRASFSIEQQLHNDIQNISAAEAAQLNGLLDRLRG